MSKKTFSTAPKPKSLTVDQIEAYEKGGAGHDRRPANAPAPQEAPKPAEPTKRLSLDLPASVHTRFKTACSATGRKMVSELQEFIERRTAELEDEAGISRK
jgi:hypothetical protein